jgi:hypothetical protein
MTSTAMVRLALTMVFLIFEEDFAVFDLGDAVVYDSLNDFFMLPGHACRITQAMELTEPPPNRFRH